MIIGKENKNKARMGRSFSKYSFCMKAAHSFLSWGFWTVWHRVSEEENRYYIISENAHRNTIKEKIEFR